MLRVAPSARTGVIGSPLLILPLALVLLLGYAERLHDIVSGEAVALSVAVQPQAYIQFHQCPYPVAHPVQWTVSVCYYFKLGAMRTCGPSLVTMVAIRHSHKLL